MNKMELSEKLLDMKVESNSYKFLCDFSSNSASMCFVQLPHILLEAPVLQDFFFF